MHRDQPSTNQVDDMMECVCVSYAVDCSVDSEHEEEDVSDVSGPRCDAGNHFAAGEGFD